MRSARRVSVKSAVCLGATVLLVGLGLASCQFPEYGVMGGSGQAGVGAKAGAAGNMSSGGTAPDGGVGGTGADGSGGEETTPDVACGTGQACTAEAPGDWLGPVAYWQGKVGELEAPPACPDGYGQPSDLHSGVDAAPAECSCSCTAVDQDCDLGASVTLATDGSCHEPCFEASPRECTTVPAACSGNQGSLEAEVPSPSGACVANVPSPTLAPATWQYEARLCSLDTKEQGTCSSVTELCIPTPERPYASRLCVYSLVPEGQPLPDCPAAYPNARAPLYESLEDQRDCAECSCEGPNGGSCPGKLTLSPGASCGNNFEYTLGNGCVSFSLTGPPTRLGAEYTLVPGTCDIAIDTKPTGDVVPSGTATAVCCR